MNRTVKLALLGAGCVAALLVVLVVLAASIDPNVFKGQISKTVKDTTGLEVSFDGPLGVSWFPSLGVNIQGVTVKSPQQAGGGVLAKVGKAVVSVKLMPLISGKVETGAVVVEALELNVVRDEQGRLNVPMPPVKDVKVEGEKVVVITEDNQRYSIDYQIEGISITKSAFTFDDRMTKNKVALTGFSLTSGEVVRGEPFQVSVGFDYQLASPAVSGRFDLSGQGKAALEAMQFAFENATMKTTATGKDLPVKELQAQYTGGLRADINKKVFAGEKLSFTATGKGGVLPEAGAGFKLSLDAKADLQAGTAAVSGLTLDSMGFLLSGDVNATGLNAAPKIQVVMATNEFNPRQVLERFGVSIQDSGTARASFTADADMGQGTASIKDAKIHALGLDIACTADAAQITGEPQVKGSVTVSEFNPRKLMASLNQPLPPSADPAALTRFKLAYAFESKGGTFSMRTSEFKLDDTAMTLSASVKNGPRPKIDFEFKADALNADRYMPQAGEAKPAPARKEQEKPLDVPADVTGTVEIGKLTASKLHMQNVSARISLKDNILDVNPATVSLYQGSVKAGLRTDARGGPNAPLSLNVNADGIQVEPLLHDMTGKAQLSGRASFNAALTARGQEAKHVLATLSGKAAFALRNGALLGVNLSPDLLSAPQNMLKGGGGQARTNLEVVSASYAISNGTASSNDLLVSAPPHRITGQGSINLPAQTLDYRLTVNFAKLAPIPVRVSGQLASPDIVPDPTALAAALAKGVIDTITKPQELIKPENLGKGALDALGGVLGGPKKK